MWYCVKGVCYGDCTTTTAISFVCTPTHTHTATTTHTHTATTTHTHTATTPPLVFDHRVQDAPAAQLYEGAGYVVRKEDVVFVRLFGLDQRKLMYKRVGPSV